MRPPFYFDQALVDHTPLRCQICGNYLELYDKYGNPKHYQWLMHNFTKEEVKQRLNKANLYGFYCDRCETWYMIDWTRGCPRPLVMGTKMDYWFTEERSKENYAYYKG